MSHGSHPNATTWQSEGITSWAGLGWWIWPLLPPTWVALLKGPPSPLICPCSTPSKHPCTSLPWPTGTHLHGPLQLVCSISWPAQEICANPKSALDCTLRESGKTCKRQAVFIQFGYRGLPGLFGTPGMLHDVATVRGVWRLLQQSPPPQTVHSPCSPSQGAKGMRELFQGWPRQFRSSQPWRCPGRRHLLAPWLRKPRGFTGRVNLQGRVSGWPKGTLLFHTHCPCIALQHPF